MKIPTIPTKIPSLKDDFSVESRGKVTKHL